MSYQFYPNQNIHINIVYSPLMWSDSSVMKIPQGMGTEQSPYLITCPEEFAYASYQIRCNNKNGNVNNTAAITSGAAVSIIADENTKCLPSLFIY